MNKIKIPLLLLGIALICLTANAQVDMGKIAGRVLDKDLNPLPYITVTIEGTKLGAVTDQSGEYMIKNISLGRHRLKVSSLGYITQIIDFESSSTATTTFQDVVLEDDIHRIDEAVVTGKSEARKRQEQAYPVTVVDLKRLRVTSASLNKTLATIPSIRIREDGGVGSNSNFSMNGFSGNQIKFFLDGIPMDNFGSSFNLSNISVNMAERVEVYKGVLPVSLGGDALGGAVNIVSRKDANYLDASYSIGSFNTHKIAFNGAYTNAKSGFTFRVNTFYNYSDNNYKVYVPIIDLNTNQNLGNQWAKRFHDKYRSVGAKFETGVVNKSYADYLLFGVIVSENDNDVQTGATMEAVYGGVTSTSRSVIPSVRYKKDDLLVDGLSVSIYGAYNNQNTFKVDTLSRRYNWLGESINSGKVGETNYPTDSKIRTNEWLANLNVAYVINDHQSLTLNHVYSSNNRKMHDSLDPENETNQIPQKLTKNITGLGWLIKYDSWNINAFTKLYNTNSSTFKREDEYTENARWARISDRKTELGYGGAATYYLLPNLQAKLSYEKAYRLPESNEMFGDGLYQQRNPDLKPESSDNANLGLMYDQQLGDHAITFEGNLIYRNTQDFILREVAATANPTTGYKNIGKVETKGIEGNVGYQYRRVFRMGVGVTYQDIRDRQRYEENTDSYVGEQQSEHINYGYRLPNIPYFFVNGKMGLTFDNVGFKSTELTLDYMVNYTMKYYLSFPGLGAVSTKDVIPEQVSHDVALGYSLQNGKYGMVLECNNITNKKLYDNYLLQKPGRSFMLKFRYFFKSNK